MDLQKAEKVSKLLKQINNLETFKKASFNEHIFCLENASMEKSIQLPEIYNERFLELINHILMEIKDEISKL